MTTRAQRRIVSDLMGLVREAERLVGELVECGAHTEQRVRSEAAGTRALDHLAAAGELFTSLMDEQEFANRRRALRGRRGAQTGSFVLARRRA